MLQGGTPAPGNITGGVASGPDNATGGTPDPGNIGTGGHQVQVMLQVGGGCPARTTGGTPGPGETLCVKPQMKELIL